MGGWIHVLTEPLPVVIERPRQPPPVVDWGETAKRMYRAGAAERERLAGELGTSVDSLEELMVGVGHDDYRSLAFSSWPERNAAGVVVGIVRRYRDGSKKTMQGSHHGLYYGRTPFAMPGPVLLPEGGSDTAALIGIGINAVGRPSNVGGVDELAKLLRGIGKTIVVLGERDKKHIIECDCLNGTCMRCWPGFSGAKITAERLAIKLKRHIAIKIFRGAKDAREWVNQHRDASAVDAIDSLYHPEKDCCRVCGASPPHDERPAKDRIEVLCRECRTLLESKRV
jgi:hypothetical protein